jgi:ADP-L-glycero-D-manno-heptose 6-epimerase
VIIVTGGAGFIGSAVIAQLNKEGIRDILVVDSLGGGDKWKNLRNLSFIDLIHKDRFHQLVHANEAPVARAVIHMGACSSTTETNCDYLLTNNFHYTRDLAEWALKHRSRFIYASSAATYGDGALGYDDDLLVIPQLKPLNMYGYSKQLFDLWALGGGHFKEIVGLKFFNVFGPNEYHKGAMRSVVHKAFGEISETGKMRLFKSNESRFPDGGQMRDFVYVKDCTAIISWLLHNPKVNGLFNLGTGMARTWNDLAKAVFAAMGKPAQIEYIPMPPQLARQYQNFTEATMARLIAAGCPTQFHSLENSVLDYVKNHLQGRNPYIAP